MDRSADEHVDPILAWRPRGHRGATRTTAQEQVQTAGRDVVDRPDIQPLEFATSVDEPYPGVERGLVRWEGQPEGDDRPFGLVHDREVVAGPRDGREPALRVGRRRCGRRSGRYIRRRTGRDCGRCRWRSRADDDRADAPIDAAGHHRDHVRPGRWHGERIGRCGARVGRRGSARSDGDHRGRRRDRGTRGHTAEVPRLDHGQHECDDHDDDAEDDRVESAPTRPDGDRLELGGAVAVLEAHPRTAPGRSSMCQDARCGPSASDQVASIR